MKGIHDLVFAMSSSRTDDTIVEEVMNALDEYIEDEWDLVSWRRSSGTRFIIRATVEARGICSDDPLKIRMMTMTHLLDEMEEPNAEWLVPRRTKVGTPAEMANRMVHKWLENLWPGDATGGDGENSESAPPAANREAVDEELEDKPQRPLQSFVKKSPMEEVMEAFGLSGTETDSEGAPLNMFVINEAQV